MSAPPRVGVVADTHGELASDVIEALEGSDLILHAGDIGGEGGEILERLRRLAPVVAVVGNGVPDLTHRYPWEQPRAGAWIETPTTPFLRPGPSRRPPWGLWRLPLASRPTPTRALGEWGSEFGSGRARAVSEP